MDSNYYQSLAMRTKDRKSDDKLRLVANYNKFFVNEDSGKMCSHSELISAILGISNESGELSRLIRKYVFYNEEINSKEVIKELGDLCWYVALCCDALGIKFEDILVSNIERLKEKYPEGFPDLSDEIEKLPSENDEYKGKEFVDSIKESIV